MATSTWNENSGAGATIAVGRRAAWQQAMTAQFDVGALAGFGAASSWQEAVVTSAARAVATQ